MPELEHRDSHQALHRLLPDIGSSSFATLRLNSAFDFVGIVRELATYLTETNGTSSCFVQHFLEFDALQPPTQAAETLNFQKHWHTAEASPNTFHERLEFHFDSDKNSVSHAQYCQPNLHQQRQPLEEPPLSEQILPWFQIRVQLSLQH